MFATLRIAVVALLFILTSSQLGGSEAFRVDCTWACEHDIAVSVCRCYAKRQSFDPDYESMFEPQFELSETDQKAKARDGFTVGSYIFRWGKRSRDFGGIVRPTPAQWFVADEPRTERGEKVQPRSKVSNINTAML